MTARWERKRWVDFKNNLNKVSQSNQFQREHFSALKSSGDWDSFDDFIRVCPFTTKDDLAKDREKFTLWNQPAFSLSEYKKFNQTSGTQGIPMAWLDTMDDWRWMLGTWDRVLEAAKVFQEIVVFLLSRLGLFLASGLHMKRLPKGACFPYRPVGRAQSRDFMVS